MEGAYCVYILTNRHNTTLYIGVTSDLKRRIFEHKAKAAPGFSNKYDLFKLVYYEIVEDVANAIQREKQFESGPRQRKVDLIQGMNPEWRDPYVDLL